MTGACKAQRQVCICAVVRVPLKTAVLFSATADADPEQPRSVTCPSPAEACYTPDTPPPLGGTMLHQPGLTGSLAGHCFADSAWNLLLLGILPNQNCTKGLAARSVRMAAICLCRNWQQSATAPDVVAALWQFMLKQAGAILCSCGRSILPLHQCHGRAGLHTYCTLLHFFHYI